MHTLRPTIVHLSLGEAPVSMQIHTYAYTIQYAGILQIEFFILVVCMPYHYTHSCTVALLW